MFVSLCLSQVGLALVLHNLKLDDIIGKKNGYYEKILAEVKVVQITSIDHEVNCTIYCAQCTSN